MAAGSLVAGSIAVETVEALRIRTFIGQHAKEKVIMPWSVLRNTCKPRQTSWRFLLTTQGVELLEEGKRTSLTREASQPGPLLS